MSNEWLLQQLALYFGGQEQLIQQLPQSVVDYIKHGKTFYSLPMDLVASILSYISLRDVRNVRSTCILFAQAMRKQHFWHRLIAQKLEQIITLDVKAKMYANAIRKFNTFECPVPETLRDQVEWIFRKKWYHIFCNESASSPNCIHFDRTTWKDTNLSNKISLNLSTLSICWYESSDFNDLDGERHQIGNHPDEFEYLIISDKKILAKDRVKKYNAVYEGQYTLDNENIFQRHGDGKWTFDDGSVLEGKGVAHMGEPRFVLEKEEWESVVKKRRIAFQPADQETTKL